MSKINDKIKLEKNSDELQVVMSQVKDIVQEMVGKIQRYDKPSQFSVVAGTVQALVEASTENVSESLGMLEVIKAHIIKGAFEEQKNRQVEQQLKKIFKM